jgi:hypothetical protein
MSDILARKWIAARTLHEVWSAPFGLLDEVLGRSDGSVKQRALGEGWVNAAPVSRGVPALHGQLTAIYSEQLVRFQGDEQSPDAEKRARALSILAKTLESITAAGTKMTDFSGGTKNQPDGNHGDFGCEPRADGTAELDRQLAQLVANLAQEGKDQ